jgi:hypothetical protein
MSWSLSAIGKVAAVKAKVQADFANMTHLQGEELALKDAAQAIVNNALESQSPEIGVRVECSGSASASGLGGEKKTQRLQILVEPLYGFVE